jgi:glutamyl-Q tRNA(Asp) synthetase
MSTSSYIGRYAPSPTGPLHFGTLVAAVGSYLQAKSRQGKWLMRIEDVDTTRSVAGAADDMQQTFESFGFEWDGEVIYQSLRTEHYEQALAALTKKNLVYPCTCSRKQIADGIIEGSPVGIYNGKCRFRTLPLNGEYALRIHVNDIAIAFEDQVMGKYSQQLNTECGDFVIKRRDGLFAYQLAVVVDDALQGITEIVRGTDLLDSTARQIYLQQQLGYAQPGYLHLPLVVDENKQKLGKSTGGATLERSQPVKSLFAALKHLGQQPPAELETSELNSFWQWAIEHWDIQKIPKHNQPLAL